MNEVDIKKIAKEIKNVKNYYLVFPPEWDNLWYVLFDEIEKLKQGNFYAVIPSVWYENGNLIKMESCPFWQGVIKLENKGAWPTDEYGSVFVKFSHSQAAKTALGIDDEEALGWLFRALKNGQRIHLIKSGMELFSGQEPNMYTKTILGYYKTLKEYYIEIITTLKELSFDE